MTYFVAVEGRWGAGPVLAIVAKAPAGRRKPRKKNGDDEERLTIAVVAYGIRSHYDWQTRWDGHRGRRRQCVRASWTLLRTHTTEQTPAADSLHLAAVSCCKPRSLSLPPLRVFQPATATARSFSSLPVGSSWEILVLDTEGERASKRETVLKRSTKYIEELSELMR